MFKYTSFQFNQIRSNFKRDYIILFCISLSISMIVGLGYFYEASQKEIFSSKFTNISDFEIPHYQLQKNEFGTLISIPRVKFSENFHQDDQKILNEIEKSSLLIENVGRYGIINMKEAFFCLPTYPDHKSNATTPYAYKKELNGTEVQLMVFDDDFYTSSRFSEYIKIILGKAPETENEIMIDYCTALKYNLTVGKISTLHLKTGSFFSDPNLQLPVTTHLYDFEISNINISGIYVPSVYNFTIDLTTFHHSYNYEDYLTKKNYIENNEIDSPAILSWYNFTGPDWKHPFQKLYTRIDVHPEAFKYLRSTWTHSGYILSYQRDSLNYDQLSNQLNLIGVQAYNLSINIPPDESMVNYLGHQLDLIHKDIQKTKFAIQILNIPTILFAIVLGLNFTQSNTKKKIEEVLYLKNKGVSMTLIKKQLIIYVVSSSLFCSIVADLIGMSTFFIYRALLGPILLNKTSSQLFPYISSFTLSFSLLLSTILNLVITIPFMMKIKQFKFLNENGGLGEGELEENLLLNRLENSQKKGNLTDLKKFSKKFSQQEKKHLSEYDSGKKSKVTIRTKLLLILGHFPILLLLVLWIGISIQLPDSLIDIVNTIANYYILIEILSILGIAMIVAGIVRIFTIDRPNLFYAISRRFSRIFVKDYDKFVGFEIIREKKWSKIFLVFSIFAALLVSSNILYHGKYQNQKIVQNVSIGADLKITNHELNYQNLSKVNDLEQLLLSYKLSETGENLISDVSTVLMEPQIDIKLISESEQLIISSTLISLDISKYLPIIKDNGKLMPYPLFSQQIRKIDRKNTQNAGFCEVIVSRTLLESSELQIGQEISISQNLFNSTSNQFDRFYFSAVIIDAIDLLPGVSDIQSSNFVLIDVDGLKSLESNVQIKEMIHLCTLNNVGNNFESTINDLIGVCFKNEKSTITYQKYDENWNNVDTTQISFDYGSYGFYGIIFTDLILIGFMLTVEIIFMEYLIYKKNQKIEANLIGRGISHNKFNQIILTESTVIFGLAIAMGCTLSLCYTGLLNHIGLQHSSSEQNYPINLFLFPPYLDVGTIALILILIFISIELILLISVVSNNKTARKPNIKNQDKLKKINLSQV
ncbi:hypothetical protein [Candidatus Lokiarchaeum ossiferum]|uniref:hypothetical protein n=1 Tax=Candidatus Lokiarchaeum ossiferum TaxID=2951803 RepID=UPI00352E4AA3